MNGIFKRAQGISSSLFPQALYVHCTSFVLNLATGFATVYTVNETTLESRKSI
jgi:hypothetical protein